MEFLARTVDTPFFNLGIVVLAPGQGVASHVHDDEDDSFLVLEGTLSLVVGDDDRHVRGGPGHVRARAGRHATRASPTTGPSDVRILNIHAPGGFDRRIGPPVTDRRTAAAGRSAAPRRSSAPGRSRRPDPVGARLAARTEE